MRPGVLGRALCRLERRDLVRALRAAALAERAVDDELDTETAQPLGHPEREVRADRDAAQPHAIRGSRLMISASSSSRVCPSSTISFAPKCRMLKTSRARDSLRARPSSSEFATMTTSPSCFEHDDRIGREEARHVIDVRELVPVGVEEEGQGFTAGFRHGSAQ